MIQDTQARLLIADSDLLPIMDEYKGDVLLTKDIVGLPAVPQQPTGQAEAIPGGRILLVGHYDPATEQMEMATWEEVSLFLGGGE